MFIREKFYTEIIILSIFLFLLIIVRIKGAETYRKQTSSIAVSGTVHSLNCFPLTNKFFLFPKWFHNNQLIVENKRGFWFDNDKKSLFFNVTSNKGGDYSCNFTSQPDINRTFHVLIEGPPIWNKKPPLNTNASEGENISFNCNASGKPRPTITFYKNGIRLTNLNEESNYIVDDNRLMLNNITYGIYGAGDNSIYQCKAENKHGYLWTNFHLNILEFKPELIKKSRDIETIEGEDVLMFCEFNSVPVANITWEGFKNIAYEVIKTKNKNKIKIRLKIVDIDNRGNYKCRGENKFGFDEGTINVVVRKKTEFQTTNDTTIIHLAGRNLKVSCKVNHDLSLEPKYEWLIDGRNISKSKLNYKVIGSDTLLINNSYIKDSTRIKCRVSTRLDSIEKIFHVTVTDVPNPVMFASTYQCNFKERIAKIRFEHQEKAYLYSPISEFWIQYLIDSYNDSTSWITYPIPVLAEEYEYIDGNTRIVKASTSIKLKPYCHYQFRVFGRNSIGDSTPTLANEICSSSSDIPYSNPINVVIQGINFNSVNVSWKMIPREEWNGPNFGYEIHYKLAYKEKWNIKFINDSYRNEEFIIFEEEKPFELVHIKVLSRNDLGIALESPEIVEGRTGTIDFDHFISNNNMKESNSQRVIRTTNKTLEKKVFNTCYYEIFIIFIIIILFQITLFIIFLCKKETSSIINNNSNVELRKGLISGDALN